MNFKSKNSIILTGAGFTCNFGGFLAKDMWAEIFNNPLVQESKNLRDLLQQDGEDYESVYSEVLADDSSFTEEEKESMKQAVEGAYKNLDDVVRGWIFNQENPNAFNIYGLGKLLNIFIGSSGEKGLFFTLNQDLMMERQNGYRCPGVPFFPQDFYDLHRTELETNKFIKLPGVEDALSHMERDFSNHSGLTYLKLHGSYGWRSSDGSNQMVIGRNKTDLISKEPILNCYFDIFKKAIEEGNKKLLIVGYGFGDNHINEVIMNGVQNHNLKLYIINTSSFADLKKRIREGHFYTLPLLEGVSGYFPYSFRRIFPPDQSETIFFRKIIEALK